LLLFIKPESYENSVSVLIELSSAIGSFVLPGLFCLGIMYVVFFLLSGNPYLSSFIAKDRVGKISAVFATWTFGRIVRGTILVISIQHDWQQNLNEIYVSMLTVGLLTVGEFIPIGLALEWSIIALLLLDDENYKFRGVSIRDSPQVDKIEQWRIDVNEIQMLGEPVDEDDGISFSQRGTFNGLPILVKGFRFQTMSETLIDELMNDLVDFSALDHPHVVQFLGVARHDVVVYQITEYLSRGSLFDLLQRSKRPLAPQTILRMAKEIAEALEFLHSSEMIHGYLSSKNVMLDPEMRVKVCDIGIRRIKSFAEVMLVKRMTTPWSAPEVLQGETASPRSDVYSFGIICWELLTRKVPYEGKTMEWIQHSICKRRERLKIPHSRKERALLDVTSDSDEETQDDNGVEVIREDESFFTETRPSKSSSKSSKKSRSSSAQRTRTRESSGNGDNGDGGSQSRKNSEKKGKKKKKVSTGEEGAEKDKKKRSKVKGSPEGNSDSLPPFFRRMISKCWNTIPESRPSIEEILKMFRSEPSFSILSDSDSDPVEE